MARRLIWFIALWLGGVAAFSVMVLAVRWLLH
jgi:hypothetical protein